MLAKIDEEEEKGVDISYAIYMIYDIYDILYMMMMRRCMED